MYCRDQIFAFNSPSSPKVHFGPDVSTVLHHGKKSGKSFVTVPLNAGGRFSMNDLTPSLPSAPLPVAKDK